MTSVHVGLGSLALAQLLLATVVFASYVFALGELVILFVFGQRRRPDDGAPLHAVVILRSGKLVPVGGLPYLNARPAPGLIGCAKQISIETGVCGNLPA